MRALQAQHAELSPVLGGAEASRDADTTLTPLGGVAAGAAAAAAGGAFSQGTPGFVVRPRLNPTGLNGVGGGSPASAAGPTGPPFVRDGRKIGRNEPCPCGSGKKYKQCHGDVGEQPVSPLPLCRVSAGILRDAGGRVLIAERPAGKHMAGWWEFPGGKATDDESGAEALARELFEELGVRIGECHRLLRLRHEYADRCVELDVYLVAEYQGEPQGLEGQALKWVPETALAAERLLPADQPIVEALLRAGTDAGVTGTQIRQPTRRAAAMGS